MLQGISLVICYMPFCTSDGVRKMFKQCPHDRTVFLMCESLHYEYMRTEAGAIVSAAVLVEQLTKMDLATMAAEVEELPSSEDVRPIIEELPDFDGGGGGADGDNGTAGGEAAFLVDIWEPDDYEDPPKHARERDELGELAAGVDAVLCTQDTCHTVPYTGQLAQEV